MKEEYLAAKMELGTLFDKVKEKHPEVSLIVSAAFPNDEDQKTENMTAVYGHPVDLAVLVDHIIHKNPVLAEVLLSMAVSKMSSIESGQTANEIPL